MIAQAWLGRRSQRAYTGLPSVSLARASQSSPGEQPLISVIVPARDEAANLRRLLPSLFAQEYPRFEVLVVNDESTDATAAVAAEHGARVIDAGPLPAGWVGKPHACTTGALAARGEWLLFCDADTWHAPGALQAAISQVRQHGLESLSLFPGQVCRTPWEQMLLPFAYQHFFAGVDARAVNDPRRPQSLLNGQYLLIHRDAYARAGGHTSVRDSVVEDVALGRVLTRSGVRHQMARGEALVQVQMYNGLGAIVAGFSKNSFRFLLDEPRRGALVFASTVLAIGPAVRLAAALLRPGRRSAAALLSVVPAYAVAVCALLPWQRRFGARLLYAVAQPLTAILFQVIALAGIWSTLRRGGTRWKGRRY